MIRAVLFDMDGTLFDTERVYRVAWARAAEECGFLVDMEEFFIRIAGRNIADIVQVVRQYYGADVPFWEMRERRRGYVEEMIAQGGIPLKAGVPSIFAKLKDMGLRCAVASSSGSEWVQKCLRLAGIDGLFEAVIAGDRVEKSKPDPEIFLTAAASLGVPPEACVVAEDSRNGVLAGHAAGMKTVMIPDLQPCTDELRPLLWHCIDSLEQMPALIEQYNLESENRT